MPVNTVSQNLAEMVSAIKQSLARLLERSSVYHQPTEVTPSRMVSTPFGFERQTGSIVVGYSGWNALSAEATQAQSVALSEYEKFAMLARVLLQGQPQKIVAEFSAKDHFILSAIQQNRSPTHASSAEVLKAVNLSLDRQLALVSQLYDASTGEACIVPDTNALLFNPSLEDWRFNEFPSFTIVLLPTVLAELDTLKVNHRVEDVRKKAEGIITRIKGYRGRGHLTEGVPLRKGVSGLLGWATEPRMETALPWFDNENADDRILASVFEVMRKFPHSPVVLVTRDINLQNKSELARVPILEPPNAATP